MKGTNPIYGLAGFNVPIGDRSRAPNDRLQNSVTFREPFYPWEPLAISRTLGFQRRPSKSEPAVPSSTTTRQLPE
jgi:hypothetical protein